MYSLTLVMVYISLDLQPKVFYERVKQILPLLQHYKQDHLQYQPIWAWKLSLSQIKAEDLSWDPIKLPHKAMGDRQGLYYISARSLQN